MQLQKKLDETAKKNLDEGAEADRTGTG